MFSHHQRQSRSWFKGADTSTLCIYLEAMLAGTIEYFSGENQRYISFVVNALAAANTFMRTLLHAGLWLLDSERNAAIHHGHRVLLYFRKLASLAYSWSITRWKFQPKYHFFGEILYGLEAERQADVPSLNPVSYSCQLDEDFVGKIAAASRVVSARTLHTRTLQRYCVQLRMSW